MTTVVRGCPEGHAGLPPTLPLRTLTRARPVRLTARVSMWTSLEPAAITVDPGSVASVRLRVRNTGDTVEEYRLTPAGTAAGWMRVEPDVLRLYPGAEGTAEVVFGPPRTPDAEAGPAPFGVRVQPREHPGASDVAEGQVTVGPFTDMRCELVPLSVRGRWRAKAAVAVDNLGNQPLTVSFSGRENGDELSVEAEPGSVQVAPGRAAFADLTIRPGAVSWVGGVTRHPFTVSAMRAGVPDPTELRGTYIQPSVLPRWVMAVCSLLLVAALAFVALWFKAAPQVRSSMQEKGSTAKPLPQPSAQPTPAESEKPDEPQDPPKEPEKEKPKGDDKPKPPPLGKILRSHSNSFSRVDSQYLNVELGRRGNGASVGTHTWTDNKYGFNQRWIIHRYPDDNTIALESRSALGMVLDKNLDTPDGVTIWAAPPENIKQGTLPDNQKWRLEDRGEGYQALVNVASGQCLGTPGANNPVKMMGCDESNAVFKEWKIIDDPGQ